MSAVLHHRRVIGECSRAKQQLLNGARRLGRNFLVTSRSLLLYSAASCSNFNAMDIGAQTIERIEAALLSQFSMSATTFIVVVSLRHSFLFAITIATRKQRTRSEQAMSLKRCALLDSSRAFDCSINLLAASRARFALELPPSTIRPISYDNIL